MTVSTMPDFPLTINHLFAHGRRVHGRSKVLTYSPEGIAEATFAQVGERADRLAAALTRLGIEPGDRVGTFMWNNQAHLEAYFAVPCMGAVLHTLNIRLFPEQLAYVINHADDRVIVLDASLAPILAAVRDQIPNVEHLIVVADAGTDPDTVTELLGETLDYETLLAAAGPGYDYPEIDERAAAAMCYTSGTTGNPKGVAYSHRSTYLHTIAGSSAQAMPLDQYDRALIIVPMFHANAWGLPYVCWSVGCDMVMPQQHLQAAPLAEIIESTRPTFSGAVPTVLADILHNRPDADLSSLRWMICGGSAVPQSLMEGYDSTFGVPVVQAWGMTETSPMAAQARHPAWVDDPDERMAYRQRTGRIMQGVEARICNDAGEVQPWDGVSTGEIEVRGPWITSSYYLDPSEEKFHDGWLRTGDVGSIDPDGYIQISDRAKDVIKSGGEWISSVDLENTLMGHPAVREAAVIGVPDDRWDERPLACIVKGADTDVSVAELREYLVANVAKWWVPERWTFIDEVPKTSVGKFDKKVLRARHEAGELAVEQS